MKTLLANKVNSQIQCLYITKRKNILIGCRKGGLLIYKDNQLLSPPIKLLQGLSISGIVEDIEGGLWITTLEKGVFYCPNTLLNIGNPPFGIENGTTFCKSIGNMLFLSNDAVPLAIIKNDTTFINKLSQENNSTVTDIVKISNFYYIATGLGTYYLKNNYAKPIPIYNKLISKNGILNPVSGIFFDSLKTCYSYDNTYFNSLVDGRFSASNNFNIKIKNGILLNKKEALVCNNDNLYRVTLIDKQLKKIETIASKKIKTISKLFKDSFENIWVLNKSGTIIVLDKLYNLRAAISLFKPDILCRNIIEIDTSKFLLSTNKGIIEISFTNSSFIKSSIQYFDKTNGLPSNDVYNIVKFKEQYYVSTSKGLSIFNNVGDLEHTNRPNTVINKISVKDSIISPTANTKLPYNRNNISFQVDALVYKKITQRGSFYKYKLKGWDNEFKVATGNTVYYNNLPPGEYKFIAKAFYDDNTEDNTPAEFSFTIKPAAWQTWWGISLIVLQALAFIAWFIKWRVAKHAKLEKEKASINQIIAEHKFTALKAQMDPHFIFNSINVIQNLILEKDKEAAYKAFGRFAKLIRMVLNQSDSVFHTIEEELNLINLYVEINQLRVDYPFEFNTNIQSQAFSCAIPSLIIQPFIENALWHGILPLKGKKKGVISLKIFLESPSILVIQIQDNGIGRKNAELYQSSLPKHKSKGLVMIEERLAAYRSMHNNCFAELNIFDLEENNFASGTFVEIKIEIFNED
jgi:hypothetical protein